MRRNNKNPFDIFCKKDVRFRDFQGTMESVFQRLHKDGLRAEVKHTSNISEEEEATLWSKGILGSESPLSLLRAVFYLNRINFCLRGGQEHRGLKLTQLKREGDHWKYIENGSKSFRCGIADLRRVVLQFPNENSPSRCHVKLLDWYIEKLPAAAKSKDAFYYTALRKKPEDPSMPWFSAVPVGWNKLDRMVKDIFLDAGIEGKTNHSLRVAGATRMYNQGIQEKTIQSQTGHKSVVALRVYERPGVKQHREACEALANISNTSTAVAQPLKSTVNPAFMAPPIFNFSDCSVNIYTAPVVTNAAPSITHNLSLTKEEMSEFENF